ncbi:MAG TPA: hypothetical protein VI916_05225 [Acidimicrobiia bacterium]|nr:hypothetical protein [Acidimicrobiia bacterium]
MNLSVSPPRRVSDPGAPELRLDVAIVVAAAWLLAVAVAVRVGGGWGETAVIGAWMLVGELLTVQLDEGDAIPLSHGLMLPLAVVTGAAGVVLVVGSIVLLAAAVQTPRSLRRAATGVVMRVVSALAAWGAYRGVVGVTGVHRPATALAALVAAGAALLVVEVIIRRLHDESSFGRAGGYTAVLAIGASGILMALGLHGVDGRGAMGLWAIPVFAVPALSARWAFGRLHAIRRTYDQTVQVLSVVPEMGGRVRPGHSRRVADLALDMADLLEVPRGGAVDLERAALLHALGSVTLDDGQVQVMPTPEEVATATFGVLRDETRMSGPAGLVAGMAGEPVAADDQLAADILRVAAAYETFAGGDPARARSAFGALAGSPATSARGRSASGRGDHRVLAALARVVARRSAVGARG